MANTNQDQNLDADKAKPRGDTGDGHTGVPAGEQGISNRPGDAEEEQDEDERKRQETLARDGTGF
jgi:hypothetical protein